MNSSRRSRSAELICRLRAKARITQVELAQRIGISFRTLQRLEAGQISPRLDLFFKMLESVKIEATSEILSLFESREKFEGSEKQGKWEIFQPVDGRTRTSTPLSIEAFEVDCIKYILGPDFDQGVTPLGYWEWNLDRDEYFWSPQMYRVYGVDENTPVMEIKLSALIDLEDQKKMEVSMQNVIRYGIPYHSVHAVTSNGERFYVRSCAKRYVDTQGNHVIFGIAKRETNGGNSR